MNPRLPYPFGNDSDVVSNTTAMTGTWAAIMILEADTIFSAITTDPTTNISVTGAITSVTMEAGTVFYGSFTNFTLSAGAVQAFNASKA